MIMYFFNIFIGIWCLLECCGAFIDYVRNRQRGDLIATLSWFVLGVTDVSLGCLGLLM